MKKIKGIVFLDIDGTIIDTIRGLTAPTIKTVYGVKELIANGYAVIIASGRPKCLLPKEVLALGANGYLLCNGAYCQLDGEVIFADTFELAEVEKLERYCLGFSQALVFGEDQDAVYVNRKDNELFADFVKGWNMAPEQFVLPDGDHAVYMLMTAFKNEGECALFAEHFAEEFAVARQYGFTSFDVSKKGINKGVGIARLLQALGLDRNDAYAFGDGLNDLEMMQAVGHSYAMANACKEVLALAEQTTLDVLDDGFYESIVKDGLIRPMD